MYCPTMIDEEKNIQPQELKLERVDTPNEVWRSCCFGESNKNAIVFFTQVSILSTFLLFCCIQMFLKDDCTNQQLYSGLATLTIGILCPNPKLK